MRHLEIVSAFVLLFATSFSASFGKVSWEKLPGSPDGSFYIIDFARDHYDRIYALSEDQGIFRTSNEGKSWSRFDSGLAERQFTGLTATRSGDIFVAGSRIGIYRLQKGRLIWRSANGNLPDSAEACGIFSLPDDVLIADVVDPAHRGSGLYRSVDGGRHWHCVFNRDSVGWYRYEPESSQMPLGAVTGSRTTFARSPDGTLLVGSGRSILRSTDQGLTWAPAGEGLPLQFRHDGLAAGPVPGVFITAVNASEKPNGDFFGYTMLDDGSYVVMSMGDTGARTRAYPHGIYRTIDGGLSWELLRTVNLDHGDSPEFVRAFYYDSDSALYAIAHHRGLYRSDDGGRSWTPIFLTPKDRPHLTRFHALCFLDSTILLASANSLIRVAKSASEWSSADKGLAGTIVTGIAALDDRRLIVAGGHRAFRTDNGGRTWIECYPLEGLEVPVSLGDPFLFADRDGRIYLFVGWDDQDRFTCLLRSDDAGTTWKRLPIDSTCRSFRVAFDGSLLAKVPTRVPNVYGLLTLRSTDNGETWQELDHLLRDSTFSERWTYDARDSILLILHATRTFMRSSDNGRSWKPIDGLRPNRYYMPYFDGLPALYLGKAGRVFFHEEDSLSFSNDNGATWTTNAVPGNEEFYMNMVVDGSTYYAGVYMRDLTRTKNGGKTWESVGTTLKFDDEIMAMTASPSGRLYVCTLSGEMFRSVGR